MVEALRWNDCEEIIEVAKEMGHEIDVEEAEKLWSDYCTIEYGEDWVEIEEECEDDLEEAIEIFITGIGR